jgi:hypothetical protein
MSGRIVRSAGYKAPDTIGASHLAPLRLGEVAVGIDPGPLGLEPVLAIELRSISKGRFPKAAPMVASLSCSGVSDPATIREVGRP